jgi:sec-independent protein translocase protein TatA
MFGMRPTELIIILFIVLLLFGANRLPELAGSLGKAMKDFRRAVNTPDEPVPAPPTTPSSSPSANEVRRDPL